MGRIFLSSAREDRACAERLSCVLEEAGHEVWWDRRMDGGEDFAAEIEAELDKADVVLVAWSKISVKSRWVRDEASAGGDSGRLVPVSIDGSMPPMGFRQFHSLDLSGWRAARRDKRTSALIRAIERTLRGKGGDRGAPAARSRASLSALASTIRPWTFAVTLSLLVAAGLGYFLTTRASQTASKPRLLIALLPFTTSSPEKGLQDIAAQTTDSLSHTLPESGVAVRMLAAPPKEYRDTGNFIISGEVSRNADKLRATVRMDDVAHRMTVFTRHFEVQEAEASALPERIGAQIAGTIAWAAPLVELELRHPSDPSVMADLMRQLDFLGDPLLAFQAAQRAAARDPNSAFAQISLAFATSFNFAQLPSHERAKAASDARTAAARAVKLAPEFGDAYSVSCYLQSETLLVDCENRLRTARRIHPDSPFADAFLSALLRMVGRFDEARQLAQLSYARDPYVPTKIGWMLRSLEFSGEQANSERLYHQGVRWWPEFMSNYFENRLLPLIERGDWQAIRRLEQNNPPEGRPSNYTDSVALVAAVQSESIPAAQRACSAGNDNLLDQRCLIAAAAVGDLDGAFALADKLYPNRVGRTPAETERIWLAAPDNAAPLELITSPAAAPLRNDPRYFALAQRTGLLAYWRSGRLPDFCSRNPEPICAKLLKR